MYLRASVKQRTALLLSGGRPGEAGGHLLTSIQTVEFTVSFPQSARRDSPATCEGPCGLGPKETSTHRTLPLLRRPLGFGPDHCGRALGWVFLFIG